MLTMLTMSEAGDTGPGHKWVDLFPHHGRRGVTVTCDVMRQRDTGS